MKGKKSQSEGPFFFITATKYVIGIIVSVVLFYILFSLIGPQQKVEASSKQLFDDMTMKVMELDERPYAYSSGYLDSGKWLIGIDSDYVPANLERDLLRPEKCGLHTNSCICLCEDDKCRKVLECKAFPKDTISSVLLEKGKVNTHMKIKGATPVTAELTLDEKQLTVKLIE